MRIIKLALAPLTALCLCLAGGCDDGKKEAKDAKADAKVADAKAAEAGAGEAKAEAGDAKAEDAKAADAKAPEAKAEAAAGGEPPATIGVAECDEYITKMTACIAGGTVPADKVEAQKMGLDMYAKSWSDAMKANPSDGASLVPGCKAAIEMGKVGYPSCFAGE